MGESHMEATRVVSDTIKGVGNDIRQGLTVGELGIGVGIGLGICLGLMSLGVSLYLKSRHR